MKSPLLREITSEERAQFLRDGVVCLRQIIDPQWTELTREGLEELRQAGVSLVEIDLVRSGKRPYETAPEKTKAYHAVVRRGWELTRVPVYPLPLRERLRGIQIPSDKATGRSR